MYLHYLRPQKNVKKLMQILYPKSIPKVLQNRNKTNKKLLKQNTMSKNETT